VTVRQLRDLLADFADDLPVWHDGGGDPYCAAEITGAVIVDPPPGQVLMGHEHDMPSRWLQLR